MSLCGTSLRRGLKALFFDAYGGRWAAATLAVVLVAGGAYATCLPSTVQGLDSGEMVSHAWLLQVPHPPGFPAYVWWTHVVTAWLPWGTVFWRASLGCSACALIALLAALSAGLRRDADRLHIWGATAGLVLPLGLERTFWLYAITPDVFALHAATTAVTLAAFLGPRAGFGRTAAVSAGFALGMANHPSTLFLAPLWLIALAQLRQIRLALMCAACVGATVAALYATLWSMHPHAVDSWGVVDSLPRLWSHAIRADYGVLQLDGRNQAAHPVANLTLLTHHIVWGTPISCALIIYAWGHMRRDFELCCVLVSLALYCVVFFSLANTDDTDILERFMLMPHVGLFCAGVYAWSHVPAAQHRRLRNAGVLAACVLAFWRLPQTLRDNDLSTDTVIEDYAVNLLQMPVNDSTSAIVTDDDTRFNALRYAQNVLGIHPQTLVLTLGTALSTSGIEKMRLAHPQFTVVSRGDDPTSNQSFYKRMMLPNRAQYTFYFTPNVIFAGFHTTYLGLGRALRGGDGTAVDMVSLDRMQWRSRPHPYRTGAAADIAARLYQDYCGFYQASARYAHSPEARQDALVIGVHRMPSCRKKLTAMCAGMTDAQACRQRLSEI